MTIRENNLPPFFNKRGTSFFCLCQAKKNNYDLLKELLIASESLGGDSVCHFNYTCFILNNFMYLLCN